MLNNRNRTKILVYKILHNGAFLRTPRFYHKKKELAEQEEHRYIFFS